MRWPWEPHLLEWFYNIINVIKCNVIELFFCAKLTRGREGRP